MTNPSVRAAREGRSCSTFQLLLYTTVRNREACTKYEGGSCVCVERAPLVSRERLVGAPNTRVGGIYALWLHVELNQHHLRITSKLT